MVFCRCPLQTIHMHEDGHLVVWWRPEVIARAAELAATLTMSVSLAVTAASDSVSTVIERGTVDSMMFPSAVMS